jgi:hypothetical protein
MVAGVTLLAGPVGPAAESVVHQRALRSVAAVGVASPVGVDQSVAPSAFGPEVVYPVKNDVSAPLGSITPIAPTLQGADPDQFVNLDLRGGQEANEITGFVDPVLQTGAVEPNIPAPILSFDGVGNLFGGWPPDTEGDVGPNHYVQWINLSFQIWNKSGVSLYGPAAGNTLWAGFGGICETNNNGDPIVLYDALADRWLMSQFAFPSSLLNNFHQCIAVSQTGDPLGAWHRYDFLWSNTKLNDYPKFGVWPDGYYMAVNQFNGGTFTWGGQGVAVFERDQMLVGGVARMVKFDLYSTDPNLGGMLPSDLDGPVPPAGAPNIFAEVDDDAWGYSPDQVQLWEFHVDWTNTANSTFTFDTALPTAAFDSGLSCGSNGRKCIPQPGTTAKLDAISDRLMYRLQYRNFGGYETLVTNHTVDVDATSHAGVRWYELRNTGGGGWVIYQQGSFAPDAAHRWMGSAAMDVNGNIALGYSTSSSTIYPSVQYTGRLASDPLGTMPQGEGTIVAGSGSQTDNTYNRWGDYSMMAVDPVDDCTFWYTQEWVQTTGSASWKTRIGSFRFPDCGGAGGPAVHSGDLDGSARLIGTRWQATVIVRVHDDAHAPVSGATVSATFTPESGAAVAASCTTNPAGACRMRSPRMATATNSFVTMTVDNITAAGFTYDAGQNHDPDGDSDGTTIVVLRP